MSSARERNALVRLARTLEASAEEGGEEFDASLTDFNRRLNASCTRSTFELLYQSEKPEHLVDRLLELRDAAPFVPPQSPEDVSRYMARAEETGRYVDGDNAGRALQHLSRLPSELAHQLGSGFGQLPVWPPRDEIVDFALGYEPPESKAELLELVRRWLDDEATQRGSVYVALGEALLYERQAALGIPELAQAVEYLGSGIEARRKHAFATLRALIRA